MLPKPAVQNRPLPKLISCTMLLLAGEQTAAATYDKETKESAIEKTTKNQDMKYRIKEATCIIGMLEVIESDFTKG